VRRPEIESGLASADTRFPFCTVSSSAINHFNSIITIFGVFLRLSKHLSKSWIGSW